jgi:hypothetical protein
MRTTCKVDRNFTVKAQGGLEEIGAEVKPQIRRTGNVLFRYYAIVDGGVF